MIERTETLSETIEEWLQQGKILLGAERFAEAVTYFDRVLSQNPMVYEAYISRGIAKANLNELDQAMADFKKAVKLDKENPDAFFHMGNISFMRGEFEDGVKQYNQAITLGYEGAELYFHFGLVYEEAEAYELAIRYYTQAIRAEALNPVYRVRKAVCQIQTEKYDEALETLDGLREVAPDIFDYYHMKAIIYTQLNRLDEAEAVLAEANQRYPDDFDLLTDRIRLLVTRKDYTAAADFLNRALAAAQDDNGKKEVLGLKGRILAAQEQLDAAAVVLEKALVTGDPSRLDFEYCYLLINIYQIQEKYDDLVRIADLLCKTDLTEAESAYLLSGPYYAALGRKLRGDQDYADYYAAAIRTYRTVAMRSPERVDAYLFRAICYKDTAKYDRALEMVDYILALQPNNGALHVIKSDIYCAMGDSRQAQQEQVLAKENDGMHTLTAIVGGLNG